MTPCGLVIPVIAEQYTFDTLIEVITSYRNPDPNKGDRTYCIVNIRESDIIHMNQADYQEIGKRLLHAREFWLSWHDEYCDCREVDSQVPQTQTD